MKQNDEGEYTLEGKLRATEKGNENSTIGLYDVKADLNVIETLDQQSDKKFMIGFFDAR